MSLKLRLLAPVVLLGSLLSGCSTPADDANHIVVATYGGTWAERLQRLVDEDMQALGIKVTYVEANAQAAMAQLIAARGGPAPYDVIELDDQTYTALHGAGYLQALDLQAMPNVNGLVEGMYDSHRVAFWANQPSLIYNRDRLQQAGVPVPTKLGDLTNPALARRIMLGDLGHYTGLYGLVALVHESGGSIAEPQAGFDTLARISPHSYFTSAALIGQLFETGELWAALSTDGAAARFKQSGLNMGTVHLKDDQGNLMLARGYLGHPKGGRNTTAVTAFINALIAAEAQISLGRETGMIPVNRQALQTIIKEQAELGTHPFSVLDEALLSSGYTPPYDQIDLREWTRRFQSAVAAQPR